MVAAMAATAAVTTLAIAVAAAAARDRAGSRSDRTYSSVVLGWLGALL